MAAVLLAVKGRQGVPLKKHVRRGSDPALAAKRTSSPLAERKTPAGGGGSASRLSGQSASALGDMETPSEMPRFDEAALEAAAAPPGDCVGWPAPPVAAGSPEPLEMALQPTPQGLTSSPADGPGASGAAVAFDEAEAAAEGGNGSSMPEWKKTLEQARTKRRSQILMEDAVAAAIANPSAANNTVVALIADVAASAADLSAEMAASTVDNQPATASEPMLTEAAGEEEQVAMATYSPAQMEALMNAAAAAAKAAEAAAKALADATAATQSSERVKAKPKAASNKTRTPPSSPGTVRRHRAVATAQAATTKAATTTTATAKVATSKTVTAKTVTTKTATIRTAKAKTATTKMTATAATIKIATAKTASMAASKTAPAVARTGAGSTRKPKDEAALRIAAARSAAPRGVKAGAVADRKAAAGANATAAKSSTPTSTVGRPTVTSSARNMASKTTRANKDAMGTAGGRKSAVASTTVAGKKPRG